MPTRALVALAATGALLATAACAADTTSPAKDTVAIEVTSSDTACDVALTQAPAGAVDFTVTNTGSSATEFYLYAAGGKVVGEVEDIGPGLSRTLHVELAEPGTYETACKPGMTGDGIRAPFTVTDETATGTPT
ncbi:MAG: cupredoxin domain-containing protein [Nostocoides sp.]